ncbi:MAG: chromosomal replication initiator protein DnaA [Flavobacteriales bacterium]
MENNASLVWKNCLRFIEDNISAQAYKTWFSPIKPLKLNRDILTIQVPSKFFYEWLEEHYIKLLKVAISRELGQGAKLVYAIVMEKTYDNKKPFTVKIPSSNREPQKAQTVDAPLSIGGSQVQNPFVIPGLQKIKVESQLNPNYVFSNFIEGDSNRLARSAGLAVAKKPGGTSFNPLLIYGDVGLGKTHLAHAIGIQIKDGYPEKTVLYVSAEKFTQQFIDSVKNNNRNDFIHFYQMIDVLLIDDVQFFSGKNGTQDVFFHIFNHLHQNEKQLILTSDKAPVDMQHIGRRLLSRFKWGLSADLHKPDFGTRVSILKHKLYTDGIELATPIVEFIAQRVKTNIRELEGALISLIAHASLSKKEITFELTKEVVSKFVRNVKKEISIEYIQQVVCDYFDMPKDLLVSKTRRREVVQARQLAMFFSKKLTKNSLARIGKQIGNRDHATVLHAVKTVTNLSETDKTFGGYFKELSDRLNQS